MWHEARRREKVTQKLFNDHKRRAEKRREENRIDPSSFLRVNGVKSNLHIDSNIYKQATKSLVVWQGDKSVTIDRFDVRATLTSLPSANDEEASSNRRLLNNGKHARASTIVDTDESEMMKKVLNYERYRLLIQNDLNKVSEEMRLRVVARSEHLDDAKFKKLRNNWFGTSGESSISQQSSQQQSLSLLNNRKRTTGVAIPFNYNQTTQRTSGFRPLEPALPIDEGEGSSVAQQIIDLDDYDTNKLDLDVVDKSLIGTKKTNEVTLKFGIDCDEFNLLVGQEVTETDSEQVRPRVPSADDLIRELKRLRERKAKLQERAELQQQQTSLASNVYGPALPPELQPRTKVPIEEPRSPSPLSGSSSPLVQQRSPSGATIPLRVGLVNDHHDSEANLKEARSPQTPPPPAPFNPRVEKQVIETSRNLDQSGPSQSISRIVVDGASQYQVIRGATEPVVDNNNANRERRASTPLAYKRYERSSRSVSRERRLLSRHRRRNDSDRSRHRRASRSRSRSVSVTSSSTGCSGSRSRSSRYSLDSRDVSRDGRSRYDRDYYSRVSRRSRSSSPRHKRSSSSSNQQPRRRRRRRRRRGGVRNRRSSNKRRRR